MTDAPNNVQIAERLGVSRAAVSRFRNGSRVPRVATRRKIAKVYGYTIEAQASAEAAGRWAQGFEKAVTGRVRAAAR